MAEKKTRVIIVEDNTETRKALTNNVQSAENLEVVASVETVAEALQATAAPFEVLLVDLDLPDGTGIDVIKFAASKDTPPEILVITVFGDERHVVSAIEAGAAGYLLKDAHPTAVADAIFQLLEGGSPITPIIARHVLKRFKVGLEPAATNSDAAPASEIIHKVHLTPRETEVLNLVSRGYSNNEIAGLLKMSFHTVTSHIKHIYVKLSVRSRSEAVFEATQMGILDL